MLPDNKYFNPEKTNLEILTHWNTEFLHVPTIKGNDPSIAQRDLRLALIFEELTELAEAYGRKGEFLDMCKNYLNNSNIEVLADDLHLDSYNTNIFNKEEALDANCDLEVVVLGAYNVNGFTDIAKEAFNRTMVSNFSKAATTLDEVHDTVDHYQKQGIEVEGKVSASKELIIIVNSHSGKILKNKATFQVPNYSDLL